jgi:hypothetical protein
MRVSPADDGGLSERHLDPGAPGVSAGGSMPARPASIRAGNVPARRRGTNMPGMPSSEARAIAEWAHRGQVEPSGRPYIEHVRRVAALVPDEAASVAWLHDVLEWTDLTEDDPALGTLAPHERVALGLLTRPGDDDDDDRFLSHVRIIAVARGAAGDIARAVKRADMEDRLRRPRDPGAAWMPPYDRALGLLARLRPSPRARPGRA